ELAPDLILGLTDDSAAETIEAESLDGLQTYEPGVLSDKPTETISLETESFFDHPEPTAAYSAEHEPEPEFEAPTSESIEQEPVEVFVTETMATLYLEQGHLEAALDIYRKLVEQRPDDSALRDRHRDVEAQFYGASSADMSTGDDAATIDEPLGAPAHSYGGP